MIAEETLTLLSQLSGQSFSNAQAEALFTELSRQDASAPNAMVTALIELLQLKYNPTEHNASLEPVFSDMLSRDRFTGYFIHPALRTIYLDFAIARSALPGQESRNFLIMGDYLNLSSVNEAIGRGTTNDVMATIAGVFLDSMTRAGVTDWLYYRSMGDEITYVVVNTDAAKVQHGIKEAERITQELIVALGLERLRHKKYPNRTGAGLITTTVALDKNINHRTLKQQMDEAIQIRKKAKQSTGWFGLTRPGIEPDQFHNRSSEQRVDKALHKYRHYRNAAQFASEAELKTTTRSALNPAKSLLIGRAIAWPRDDRIEYLRHHHDNTKIMLRADVYNLGGLNAVFGHDGADHVKSHLIRILYNTIVAHDIAEPKIFDCGGGIIDIVINTMGVLQLQKLLEAIQSNIYYQILSHSISGYANAYNLSFAGNGSVTLAELPHPKGEHEGTGLVLATHPVESSRSLPEIIERLDKITHRTKMHDFAYLWADSKNYVYAYALNRVPDPIEIGFDRARAGSHYLPFTDALRQHINEDDLPSIFERPAGQICETVFGTDMQAVLGFKKAIRLLQDKQIPDDDIEKINSYKMMDDKLREENLPPLSVVSTQNRPAFVNNERGAFKTMALAEKLEDLPPQMTNLILQAQACFRTLKMVQPHGHLAPSEAAQVLLEDIHNTKPPKVETGHHGAELTESLYLLTRLFDRGYATLGRDLPDDLQRALSNFSYETLKDLATAFDSNDETLLAKKLNTHIREHQMRPLERHPCLDIIFRHLETLVERLQKKQAVDNITGEALYTLCRALFQVMKKITDMPSSPFAAAS
jgi:GGDEF domain-containing protein